MMKISSKYKHLMNPLFNLPTPLNISLWWNMGSLLGVMLMSQIITGLLLTMHFSTSATWAFLSVSNMMQNISNGWLIRFCHSTGASFMMLFIYFHIGRNIYFSNLKNSMTAMSGLIILLISMMTAFLGYVLPWGQMSFWGATVITSLASAIPIFGKTIVMWLWGSFAVSAPTLNRFFMLHYILPFMIMLMMMIHLISLHTFGSLNSLNQKTNMEMIYFHPKFTMKDFMPIWLSFTLLFFLSIYCPYMLMDPENFIIANPLSTPNHIQPEWYFLFSYAILRCIPNKIGGVMALIFSIVILLLPMFKISKNFNNSFYSAKKMLFWLMFMSLLMLMWIGAYPVSDPLIFLAQIYSIFYFLSFMIL